MNLSAKSWWSLLNMVGEKWFHGMDVTQKRARRTLLTGAIMFASGLGMVILCSQLGSLLGRSSPDDDSILVISRTGIICVFVMLAGLVMCMSKSLWKEGFNI